MLTNFTQNEKIGGQQKLLEYFLEMDFCDFLAC